MEIELWPIARTAGFMSYESPVCVCNKIAI